MQKKITILEAAERLFYRNGFHATSTDRICREANISTRTLYRYFPSLEDLTAEVMAHRQSRFFATLYTSQHPQAISRLFDVLEEWMREYDPLGCFFLKAWGEYAEEEVKLSALALDYRYALRGYIVACIGHSHGVGHEALADAVWMLSEGAITSALLIGPDAARHAGLAAARLMAGCEEGR